MLKKTLAIVLFFSALRVFSQTTISDVYVESSTATTATIVWTTSTPSTSQIKYGYSSSIPFSNNTNYTLVTSHSMTLVLLNSLQPYYFAVVSVDGSGHSAQSSTYEFALCGSPTVPVSGTVNQFYYEGTYSITWNAPSGSGGTPTICGQPLTTTVSGTTNFSGGFSTEVADALKVTPGPGTWTVAVQDKGDLSPISVTLPLSATTQDISTQLQAAASGAGLVGVIANANSQTVYPSWITQSVPSGSAGQLVYYAANGKVLTPLNLGTNLSISGGALNASAAASTQWAALTGGTSTGQSFVVGNSGSLSASGTGTISATSSATSTQVATTLTSANAEMPLALMSSATSSSGQGIEVSASPTINPSTGDITGTSAKFSGSVTVGSTGAQTTITANGVNTPALAGGTVNGILSAVTYFGAKCDGTTDDYAALNAIGTFFASHPASAYEVDFPSGSVCNFGTTISNWLTPNLHIEGHGVQLHFTGTGTAIYLNSVSSEVDNVIIHGLWLRGNANATWAIDNESTMARGSLQIIEAQDFATGCFNMTDTQLMNEMDLTCSSTKATQMGIPQTTQPVTGINLGSSTTGHVFANNRTINLTMEGVSGTGINAIQVCCGTNVNGTSEDNGIGVETSANTKEVNWHVDAENNLTADYVDAGQGENFLGITSTGLFHITTGYNAFISGGNFNSITIDSTANNITAQNFVYGTNSGTITASSSSSNVTLRGIQSGTGTPYFFTAVPVEGPSETITGLQKIFDTPNTGQSAARNYCETLDGTGYGLFELWASSTSTGTACYNGTAITQVSPGNYYRIYGSSGFEVLPSGTVSWGGGSGITSSSDVALTSQLSTGVTVSIIGGVATGTATVPSGTVGCSFSATNASASTDVKTNGAYGSVAGTTFTLTLGANATGSDTFYALCR